MAEDNPTPVPEMIERVARAMLLNVQAHARRDLRDLGLTPRAPMEWDRISEQNRLDWLDTACAVIEVMREATEAMEAKAGDMLEELGGDYKDAWRFMIDAALGR